MGGVHKVENTEWDLNRMKCLLQATIPGYIRIALTRPLFTSPHLNAGRKPGKRKERSQAQADDCTTSDGDVKGILEGLDFSDTAPTYSEVPVATAETSNEELAEEDDIKSRKSVPAEVRCFDTARICVKSGDGGNGCVAFRREKFVPKGGPSGADGGRGGHVWAIADEGLNSLLTFRRQLHWRAKGGTHGKGSNLTGAQGEDLYIPVPPGTIIRIKDAEEGAMPLAELTEPGMKAVLLPGGRGGRGNASFKTGINTAPQMAEQGEKGEEAWVDLELKLVADAGIIGVPNAGKSTLLASISAAKPKIANYPFTTLVPNLGVCELDYETTVFADVPGLLEGAADGFGLGHEFLRHCMRCKVLVHIVDGTSEDPLGDYEAIQLELQLFNKDLSSKPQVICYNKMDDPDVAAVWPEIQGCFLEKGVAREDIFAISAVAGTGVKPVIRRARQLLRGLEVEDGWPSEVSAMNYQAPPKPDPREERLDNYTIEEVAHLTPRVWIVHGKAIERFTQMTNWSYYESLRRFHRLLKACGISESLRERGIKEGDDVVIGEMEFEWKDETSEDALFVMYNEARKEEGRARKGQSSWPHVGG